MEFGYFLLMFGAILLIIGIAVSSKGLRLKPEYGTKKELQAILHNKIGLGITFGLGPLLIIIGIILALYE